MKSAFKLASGMVALLCTMLATSCDKDPVSIETLPEAPSTETPGGEEPVPEEPGQNAEEDQREESDWKSFRKVSSFPRITIDVNGGASIYSKETYVNATMTVSDPEGMYCDEPSLTLPIQIRGRGNTTWNNPKKPYRIKLDEKSKLLGMKANRDWVLLANYSDKTLLRNSVAMEISRICQMSWTPNSRAAEVYLNGSYLGVYDLFQKVEVAKEKVDLEIVTESDIEGENLTGDYFLEIDTTQDEPCSFTTPVYAVPLMFKEPKYPAREQEKYVRDYFSQADKAFSGTSFADPQTGYRKYLDVDSFINFFIVQELVKNIDGGLRKSTFMALHRNGKAEIACVWDFDLTLGNANYFTDKPYGSNGPEGWWVREYKRTGKNDCWFSIMFRDPSFTEELKAKWNKVKPELDQIPQMVETLVELNRNAIDRNFRQWPILGQYVWPNVVWTGDYDSEIDYMLDFYTRRLEWLDTEINAL